MSNNNAHIDQLIARYLTGEASPEEAIQLEQWMDESPENKKYFGDIRFVHDKTIASHKYIKVNTEKAWDKVRSQMKPGAKVNSEPKIIPLPVYKTIWFRIAASITLLIGISSLFYFSYFNYTNAPQELTIASADSTIKQTLSKNTQIVLNRNSQITYKTKAYGKKQEIELTGEAFIKVKHSTDTALIVKAEETFIRDIGTSFNVKAYPDNNVIEVYVETGEVAFYTQDQNGLILTKGERGIYEKTSKTFRKVVAETPNIIAYSTKLLIFRNSTLSDVVNALNNVYPETIELSDPSIANCSITVTFDNESIVSIVDIIAETIGLQLIKTETGFLLKGDNCINR